MKVRVHVKPGSRREHVEKTATGDLIISVREKAEHNEANDRVKELVARTHQMPLSKVRLMTGMRSPKKTFEVLP
jgi:uncharacterized protein YggU (UPF0235/DUF167 family)